MQILFVDMNVECRGEDLSGTDDAQYGLHPIGWVESTLKDSESAPKQGDEGAPEAWLVFQPAVPEGRSAR